MARLGLLHAENVEMWGHHGHKALNINEGEKYLVDVKVWYDMEKQIEMDTVEDGISYYDIDDHIKETFDADHHTLLQPVARNMANSLVERCPLAQRVEVTIKKKFTIFPAILDYVAVTVTNDGVENPINRISLKNIRMWGVHGSAHEREIGEEYRVNIAADSLGIKVVKIRYIATIVSSVMAAIGGVALSIGNINTFVEDMSAGKGWIALAALSFVRWNPIGVALASILFGLADAFQLRMQIAMTDAPYQYFQMIPYIVTIIVLIWTGRKGNLGPKTGEFFEKEAK